MEAWRYSDRQTRGLVRAELAEPVIGAIKKSESVWPKAPALDGAAKEASRVISRMIGRLAGFLSILAGALVAVGAFPTWVTLRSNAGSSSYNAFSIIGDNRDAIVSFALAVVLLVAGFVLSVRPTVAARLLGALAGIGAALWAGLLYFSLAPQAHALIAPTGPSASTSIEIGLWITAGGGLLGLLSALTAATSRPGRQRVEPAAPAADRNPPVTREPAGPAPIGAAG